MFFNRGYNGINNCFDRFGFMPGGGWMILILVAVILIAITVIILISRGRRRHSLNNYNSIALDELKLLYARGEISEEEYLKRKNILNE